MALNFIKESITIGADKITDKTFTFFKQGFRLSSAIGEPEYRDVTVSGVDVLNLPNAKVDGLNYCKLYGKCEQRDLPEGYTQVEYLQSSGTQWINTGYKPNANIKFEISGTQSNTDSALFGISEVFFCFDNGNATYYNFFGGSVGSFSSTLKNVPVVLTMSASDGIVINGTKYKSLTAGSATANYSMALFGRRNKGTGAIEKLGSHIIKYAKIYESNILIHNYIPCRRNSDSVLGMYDTVTGNFLTNAGTGTFTAGNDVVPTPTRPLNIICNNGVVKVSPNLFDKNNYIKATIDTNGTITQNNDNDLYIMNVSPNNSYIFSYTPITAMSGNCLYGYTKELPTIGGTSTYNIITIGAIRNKVFTVPDGYHYLVIRLNSTTFVPNMRNIQFEQGTTATTYMPYKQVYTDGTTETVQDSLNNTATAEMLLAVNDYKDVQEVLSGDVTKNVGIKVLTGSETWTTAEQTGGRYRYKTRLTDAVASMDASYSNYFLGGKTITEINADTTITEACTLYQRDLFIYTKIFATATDLTTWLAEQYANGTPIIVVYPLATPTTSTVTAQTLTTQEGTNTIEITQASLTDLPIEVSYKAGVSVTITQIENANLDNQVTVTIGE